MNNMDVVLAVYVAILLFVLTPGVLLSLPMNGDKLTVAGVHAIVFAVVFSITNGMVMEIFG